MDFDLSHVDECGLSDKFKEFNYLWIINDFTPFIPENKSFQIESSSFQYGSVDDYWVLKLNFPPLAETDEYPTLILNKYGPYTYDNVLISLNFLDKYENEFGSTETETPGRHVISSTIKYGDVFKSKVTYDVKDHLDSLLWKGRFRILLRMWEIKLATLPKKAEDIFASKKIKKPVSKFAQSFEQLFKNAQFSDVIIRSESVDIPAHKCVLAAGSHVFETMFNVPMTESLENVVEIEEFPLEVVKGMLEWIYTDKTEINRKKAIIYLQIAHMYDLEGLRHEAEIVLGSNLNLKNALVAFQGSILYKTVVLKSIVSSFIAKNKKYFVSNPDFMKFVHGNEEALKEFLEKI